MGMPTIPKQPFRPDLCKTIIDLLESIALEEVALSHLLNAEAEKVQAFVCKYGSDCEADFNDLISFNQSVNSTLNSVVMKEFLLLQKLETTLQIADVKKPPRKFHGKKCPPKPSCPSKTCDCPDCRKERE
ncbi:hypothetical protein B0H94_11455 [Salsuginibacillus halophilus]|uniref:Uncharacterized protein n=1 Tax=Salsuginibacillus halophilus TaxID=517424 RepID=A0A2P8H8R1_9BACI|nr:hypothetical protein [Salsuginibacillus halophilus]PSL42581.1 hypothetical protein B0H94_11455 [Salsuginibacillus halophilus]